MIGLCRLQSLVKGISSMVLKILQKIVGFSCERLDIDPVVKGEEVFVLEKYEEK